MPEAERRQPCVSRAIGTPLPSILRISSVGRRVHMGRYRNSYWCFCKSSVSQTFKLMLMYSFTEHLPEAGAHLACLKNSTRCSVVRARYEQTVRGNDPREQRPAVLDNIVRTCNSFQGSWKASGRFGAFPISQLPKAFAEAVG